MMARCYNPTHKSYPQWGGRGITVCDAWRTGFHVFLRDMGPPPAGHSLDRIDNDGPYSPENCRWATPLEQQANRTDNAYLTIAGERLHLAEWARRMDLDPGVLYGRRARGWSDHEVVFGRARDGLTRGFGQKRGRKPFLVADDGHISTLKQHAERLSIPYGTLYQRFKRGAFGVLVRRYPVGLD